MYKIYHAGDHPVATRMVRSKGKRPPKKPAQTAFDIAFDSLYFQAKRKGLSGDEMVDYIQAGLEKLYPASSTYSRGTPTEICKELSENDEVGTYFDYVTKYVLWDDVLDWERDIKDYGKKKRLRV